MGPYKVKVLYNFNVTLMRFFGFRNNFETLVKEFTLNDRYFGLALYHITAGFKTEERLKEVKK